MASRSLAVDGPVRAAVLGSPIGHSLSPVLHSAAYAELGLRNWSYGAVECDESAFAAWFAELGPEWRGLSLTMPLKRVVAPLLHRISPLAVAVGAVNTVIWDDEARPIGENTDVQGIVEAVRAAGAGPLTRACIVGAGATACSAVAALAQLGAVEVVVLSRAQPGQPGGVLEVAARMGLAPAAAGLEAYPLALAADVVISTLPAAPAAQWAAAMPAGRPAGVLLDVTYHPWPTPAAERWTAAGGRAVGGFEMLLHQAAGQFTLMTGRAAPLAAMRLAGEKALAERG